MSIKSQRVIWTISIPEYVHNKSVKRNIPFKIVNGVGYLLFEGEWRIAKVVDQELNELFPTPKKLFFRHNSDHTKDFINLP